MKVAIVFLCLTVAVVVRSMTTALPGTKPLHGTCTHQSDCAAELCCVHKGFGIGKKRFIFGGDDDHTQGTCEQFRTLNETCMPFLAHDIFNHELYQGNCPCQKGLECRGETVDEGPHTITHRNPKCQGQEK